MESLLLKLSDTFPVSETDFSFDMHPTEYLHSFKSRIYRVNEDNCYRFCGELATCFQRMASKNPINQWDRDWLLIGFQLLDLILIISGPNEQVIDIIRELEKLPVVFSDVESFPVTFYTSFPAEEECLLDVVESLSPSSSISHFKQPFIITKLALKWPAVKKWQSPRFWIDLAGHRSFPVEIGKSYLEQDWRQEIMLLKDYLDTYVFKKSKEIAYIAQHNWIHQLPCLVGDFSVDNFPVDPSKLMIHFWFGMSATLTPLHFDNYNNFFAQIVGYKRITLVDPIYSSKLTTDESGNTCTLSDDQLNSILSTIPHETIILKPGEILFIPQKWWHRVESLTFSISLSFWY